jgi:hypothetical protein
MRKQDTDKTVIVTKPKPASGGRCASGTKNSNSRSPDISVGGPDGGNALKQGPGKKPR